MASVTTHLHKSRHMPRTSPFCNYFVFFKYITNGRSLSTLFSILCCFGAQFTILSFSPPAPLGSKCRTMYPPRSVCLIFSVSCTLFSRISTHRVLAPSKGKSAVGALFSVGAHIVRPPTYAINSSLGNQAPPPGKRPFHPSTPPKTAGANRPGCPFLLISNVLAYSTMRKLTLWSSSPETW